MEETNIDNKSIEITNQKILLLFNELSERSKNVLSNYLQNDHSIESYKKNILFNQNFSVNKLRNCGEKTCQELSNYFAKITDIDNIELSTEVFQKEEKLKKVCDQLDDSKVLKIEKYIQDSFKTLNVRAQNALKKVLNKINFLNVQERILFNKDFEIRNIKNIGKSTVPILQNFISNLEDYIIQISNSLEVIKKDDLFVKISIESLYDRILIDEDLITNKNYLRIIDSIINSENLFNKKEKLIFTKNLNIILGDEKITISDLKIPLNLSRERIRQIKVQILSSLVEKFQFVKLFSDDFLNVYNIDKNDNFISLSYDQINELNKLFGVNYTQQFHTFILSFLLDSSFSLIGQIDDVLSTFERVNDLAHHNWDHLYLVKNDLIPTFDFSAFVDDVYIKISENSSEGYKFHIKSYLSNFLKVDDYSLLTNLLPICEEILEREFNIILDTEECIVFERTKMKTIAEYALEALERIGKPAHISEITECIKETYPEFSKKVTGANLTNRSIFSYFGRSSIYGLVKWEAEQENIKGGTIKDFVIEYLNNKETPIHIFELFTEISKYRNETYIRSILDNLKAKPSSLKFVFYSLGFIGLKNKEDQYEKKYNLIPRMLTKTIISKIQNHTFETTEDIQLYLYQKYNLTKQESLNYINYLEYLNSPFFKK